MHILLVLLVQLGGDLTPLNPLTHSLPLNKVVSSDDVKMYDLGNCGNWEYMHLYVLSGS